MIRRSSDFTKLCQRIILIKLRLATTEASHTEKCWACDRVFNEHETKLFFCPCEHQKIQPVNKTLNYFELLDLKMSYKIDQIELTKKFRALMKKLHPDLFVQKSEVFTIYTV